MTLRVGGDPPATGEPLRGHLVVSGLAGRVQTGDAASLENCAALAAGEGRYTFGLSDWRDASVEEIVEAVRRAGGTRLGADRGRVGASRAPGGASRDPGGAEEAGFIDPDATLAGIRAHREALAGLIAAGGGRVLVATGHPFSLLSHYGAIARALAAAGCDLLRPLEGRRKALRTFDGRPCSVRYLDSVASICFEGGLHHTHRPHYMEAMLEELGGPSAVDLVIADHGYAGAAIETGIRTLSIADINDPALPLAQARGRTDAVLLIDDGLDSALFEPVTAAMLDGLPPA